MTTAGCNLWRNWNDIQCSWASLGSIIDHWANYSEVSQTQPSTSKQPTNLSPLPQALEMAAGIGHWNDPDMLLIGANVSGTSSPCVSIEEERTQVRASSQAKPSEAKRGQAKPS